MDTTTQEALYIRSRDPQQYARLQFLTKEGPRLRTSLTQKKLLTQSQCIFRQGERLGRLLAWLSKEQSRGISVPHILGPDGDLLYALEEIIRCFVSYYRSLYSSRVTYGEDELTSYLEDIDIPALQHIGRTR